MQPKEKEEGSKEERAQRRIHTKKGLHMREAKNSTQLYEEIVELILTAKEHLPPQRFELLANDIRRELERPVTSCTVIGS